MVGPEERIAYLEERIRMLEESNAFFWKEKNRAMEALESAIRLGSFDTSLNRLDDPQPILDEILKRAMDLLPFKVAALYLVNDDSSFRQALCIPAERALEVEDLVARRIEDRTFSWALKRKKPVLTGVATFEPLHVMHVLTTISRTRGMFAGIIDGELRDVSDYSLSLLSVLLSNAAEALESFELYHSVRSLNRDLSERMSQLEESRRELEEYRKFLEFQVEKRTMDLSRANEEMKMEIAERMRVEEDLRSSEEMLRLAVEGMSEGLWIWDHATGSTALSPLSIEILCEAEGKTSCDRQSFQSTEAWDRLVLDEDRDKLNKKRSRCFSGKIPSYSVEYRVEGADGRSRWILERGRVVRKDGAGNPLTIAGTHSDITGRKELEEHILFQATHDFLTGLPNRFLFEDRLTQTLARARRLEEKAALFFLDLDDFKMINDRFGHAAGDLALQEAASLLTSSVRSMDTVCRLGGDEFTVILPSVKDAGDAETVARRIIDVFDRPLKSLEGGARLRLSVGIALYPDHGNGADELLRRADEAMYRAKEQGSGHYSF
ncbi:MAG: diguanylate cyclase domain-containing protein [Aminivibrio sp.]|jgi:diguanylate cyclase (GGDEF)-like protein/PAS domain S-box-containing protein